MRLPIAFARLLYNIHKNVLSNVTAIECAISDCDGELPMHYEWEHAVAAGTTVLSDNVIYVPKKTGDRLCQSIDYQPDIIKIDVEGHEVKVLRGLIETIQNWSPLILLEVHPKRIAEEGDSSRDLEEMFYKWNYTAKTVSGSDFPLSHFSTITREERLILTASTNT